MQGAQKVGPDGGRPPMPPGPAGLFAEVPGKLDFPAEEARILAFWKAQGIFKKTLAAETRATGPSKGTYVFYEGPPTANGMPHNGHALTRAVKDVFPRFQTMRGYDVPRKAGWDTHGLPVEVEVEKELAIHGKAAIVEYGVKPFISRCIASVFRYTEAWERLTDKIGFWVDTETAYVTYHKSYVESVWWALSELHKKGLLYRGHRVCWWWPQGGTALSAAEVGLNYKSVDDPSVFVAFPLVDEPGHEGGPAPLPPGTALVAWTTTPWTLPSNGYAAVRPEFDYVVVDGGDRKLIVAAALREGLAKKLKRDLPVVRQLKGSELIGKRYTPPFDTFSKIAVGRRGAPRRRQRRARADLLARHRRLLRHARRRHRGRPRRPRLRRGRLQRPQEEPGRALCARRRRRDPPHQRGAPRRDLRAGDALRRGLRQGRRQGPHQGSGGAEAPRPPRALPPRLPVLLARRRRPAHPARAPGLVHPHPGQQGEGDREQPRRPVAAGAHQGGALRRLPRQQRRLGALARALLGHAAQRVGVRRLRRRDRALQHGGDRGPEPEGVRRVPRGQGGGPHPQRAPRRPQAVDRRSDLPLPRLRRRRDVPARDRGHRRLVRLREHALRAVGLPPCAGVEGALRPGLPGGLHQRGDRPDPRVVLLAADDLDAALRRGGAAPPRPGARAQLPAPVQDVRRARARERPRRQEGEQVEGQLHAARGDPGARAHGVRRLPRGRRQASPSTRAWPSSRAKTTRGSTSPASPPRWCSTAPIGRASR